MQKNAKFSSAGGSALRPPCLRRLGTLPSNPQPPAAGGFAPRPLLASGGWGSAPRPPKQPSHCEFLATRLQDINDKHTQRWSRGHKARGQGQGHKKIRGQGQPFRGQTLSMLRIGILEAKDKDRNARGQRQGHSRKCSPKKKKVFKKVFQAISNL